MYECMTIWGFMAKSPVLTFFICCMIFCGSKIIFRTIMVASRGWPPEHLDADGDLHQKPKKESETKDADV